MPPFVQSELPSADFGWCEERLRDEGLAPYVMRRPLSVRATDAAGTYVVTISAEREVLPSAQITIWAQPVGNAARCWPSFESHLRVAVQLQFPDCDCQWMTIDEYSAIDPSR